MKKIICKHMKKLRTVSRKSHWRWVINYTTASRESQTNWPNSSVEDTQSNENKIH